MECGSREKRICRIAAFSSFCRFSLVSANASIRSATEDFSFSSVVAVDDSSVLSGYFASSFLGFSALSFVAVAAAASMLPECVQLDVNDAEITRGPVFLVGLSDHLCNSAAQGAKMEVRVRTQKQVVTTPYFAAEKKFTSFFPD